MDVITAHQNSATSATITGIVVLNGPPPAWRSGLSHHGVPWQETTCTKVAQAWALQATVQALIVCVDAASGPQTLSFCQWALTHTELAVLVWSPTEPPSELTRADDWITGPIEPIELAARLRAALRRSHRARTVYPPHQTPTIDTRPWQVDVQQRQVMDASGAGIPLSPREWQLWMVLLSHRGQVLSTQRLGELMRDAEQGTHAIQLLVSRLRQKLQRAGAQGASIEAVRGWGYRLTSPVTADKLQQGSATP